jgi:hypothetical protein
LEDSPPFHFDGLLDGRMWQRLDRWW